MEPLEWAALISAFAATGTATANWYNGLKTSNTISAVNANANAQAQNTTTMILTLAGLYIAAKYLKVI